MPAPPAAQAIRLQFPPKALGRGGRFSASTALAPRTQERQERALLGTRPRVRGKDICSPFLCGEFAKPVHVNGQFPPHDFRTLGKCLAPTCVLDSGITGPKILPLTSRCLSKHSLLSVYIHFSFICKCTPVALKSNSTERHSFIPALLVSQPEALAFHSRLPSPSPHSTPYL